MHAGSPTTNTARTKVWTASYLPFGSIRTTTGTPITARFPGQWFQSESGLHQNWMRDYDPTTGRYLQADPLGLIAGTSVYGYANQSPMMYMDPNGENPYLAIAIGLTALGVLVDYLTDEDCYTASDFGWSVLRNTLENANPFRPLRWIDKLRRWTRGGDGPRGPGGDGPSAGGGGGGPPPAGGGGNRGDLSRAEQDATQGVVNDAGRPLEIVGSAARGERTLESDIDYVAPPSSHPYFRGLEDRLPGLDPDHGIIPGVGNTDIGPVIRFEPD